MERIQAAIAKARAARDDHDTSLDTTVTGLAPAPSADTTPPAPDARRAAWGALSVITPSPRWLARNRIVAAEGGREATSFDLLRTRTLQQMQSNGWKRLAITSPSAGCGKSTVSLNLALSMTRQAEKSVVLIEMDMRRPSIAKTLGLTQRHSVADVLSGKGKVADNAVRFGDNLALLTMHGQTRNPSDILHGDSVARVLSDIEATFAPSVMIFDLPPLLVNDDTLAFLKHVDAAMLVAAAGSTTISEIDTCERELAAHTGVMGVVLNKCRYPGRDYGSDYY